MLDKIKIWFYIFMELIILLFYIIIMILFFLLFYTLGTIVWKHKTFHKMFDDFIEKIPIIPDKEEN